MNLPPIGVVTVTHNSSDVLRAFLESLRTSTDRELDVVVADNSSSDTEHIRALADEFGARFLPVGRNAGYGGAANAGAAVLDDRCEFIVIANPDVVFHQESISRLADTARAHEHAAAVGPRILNADGSTYPSARRVPSLVTGTLHALLVKRWPTNPWTTRYHDLRQEGRDRESDWLSGACMLVRRTAFEQAHGFDEAFFMYFEDVDLCRRFVAAGWSNVYSPASVVTHTGAHSTANQADRMSVVHHQSAMLYVDRRYPRWYQAPLRWGLRLGLTVRGGTERR